MPPSAARPLAAPLAAPPAAAGASVAPHYWVIAAISLSHLVNDLMQSLLAAIYPLLQMEFALSYAQIGLMTLAFMGTASVLQPLVGLATDRRPTALALPAGMASTLVGLIFLAAGPSYPWLLAGATLIGIGSAIFHPEASRVARAAAGGRFGTAQSVFQLGGNAGHAIGPLLAAFVVVPFGRPAVAAFAVLALAGMALLAAVSRWHETARRNAARAARPRPAGPALSRGRIAATIAVLLILVFSKNAYGASLASYYTFFVIETFGVTAQTSQIVLFLYMAASAAGVVVGGIVGDRIGAHRVIWVSILGTLPFSLILPHVGLVPGVLAAMAASFILASAFPAIVVYAQELVPGRVGLIAGLFFGFAFGTSGVAAAALGLVADARGIDFVFVLCSFLPAVGLLTVFLPRRPALGA